MPNYPNNSKMALPPVEEPPYLTVGTDVSAKYKGAFCEAKIIDVNRHVKLRVLFKGSNNAHLVDDTDLKPGCEMKSGCQIEAKHPDKNTFILATVTKVIDHSRYTVIFDDGDQCILRRNSLCLKSGKHFAESETLDQLPLTNPEHFGNPVKVGQTETSAPNSRAQSASSIDDAQHQSATNNHSNETTATTTTATTTTTTSNVKASAVSSSRESIKNEARNSNNNSTDSGAPVVSKRGVSRGRKRRESTREPPENASVFTGNIDKESDENSSDYADSEGEVKNLKFELIEVGVKLKVKYGKGKLQKVYEAKVNKMETNAAGKPKYFVHYTGWNNRYDEWITRCRIIEIVKDEAQKRKEKELEKDKDKEEIDDDTEAGKQAPRRLRKRPLSPETLLNDSANTELNEVPPETTTELDSEEAVPGKRLARKSKRGSVVPAEETSTGASQESKESDTTIIATSNQRAKKRLKKRSIETSEPQEPAPSSVEQQVHPKLELEQRAKKLPKKLIESSEQVEPPATLSASVEPVQPKPEQEQRAKKLPKKLTESNEPVTTAPASSNVESLQPKPEQEQRPKKRVKNLIESNEPVETALPACNIEPEPKPDQEPRTKKRPKNLIECSESVEPAPVPSNPEPCPLKPDQEQRSKKRPKNLIETNEPVEPAPETSSQEQADHPKPEQEQRVKKRPKKRVETSEPVASTPPSSLETLEPKSTQEQEVDAEVEPTKPEASVESANTVSEVAAETNDVDSEVPSAFSEDKQSWSSLDERIYLLQEHISAIRRRYMSLKLELAHIDRKRKRTIVI